MSVIQKLRIFLRQVWVTVMPLQKSPEVLLGDLLRDVQMGYIFDDSIAFIDLLPPKRLKYMLREYEHKRQTPEFDLRAFVQKYFAPDVVSKKYTTNKSHTIEQHIEALWPVLTRDISKNHGSLIGLPYPYIVPGGRYQTMFYWDSYFVMLGLAAGGHWDMAENMLKNFTFMLRKFGYIPNGNRTYYIGRSQAPFFAMMVRLLAAGTSKKVIGKYVPSLLIEHRFWTKGYKKVSKGRTAFGHVVHMPDGELLGRYFDAKGSPRPEGYIEDVHTVLAASSRAPSRIHADIRAAAESGWDFSSRWFKDGANLSTIRTTDLVPVDLNCLLFLLEQTIAKGYKMQGRKRLAAKFRALAKARAQAINKYCWDEKKGYYFDFDLETKARTTLSTLAGILPMYAGIATPRQAKRVVQTLHTKFLKKGGLITTTAETGQQWDAPNGWPPMQWVAIRALRRYGFDTLANEIKRRWIHTNTVMFKQKHKLVEKYNVVDPTKMATGGEYVLQDGFGWTNGVMLALLHEDAIHWEQ